MKRGAAFWFALLAALPVVAQEEGGPAAFEFVVGPRLGVAYYITTVEEFSGVVAELYPEGEYFPVYTMFGITLEQRIRLGNTRSHFAFQELVLVGGLEQSVALPMAALLIGYRDWSGFEAGMGPMLNLTGVGVVVAVGWTLSFNGVFVPLDLSLVLPSSRRAAGLGFTTGFNFKVRRKELDTF
jgi:hypothetical protein